jgi:hypothetical protein
MQKSKLLPILIVGGVVVIASVFFLRDGREEQRIHDQKKTTVIIDYGNGSRRQFYGDGIKFMEDENAWSILQRAAAGASIPLEVARGFYPIVINGKRSGQEGKRWVFYVNGERQNNNMPLEAEIKEGDEVIWKFE